MHLVLAAFSEHTARIEIPPPAMLRPQKLWSGKQVTKNSLDENFIQVISCIIKNCIPAGQPLINLRGTAKTPLRCWKAPGAKDDPALNMSESEVIFR